MQDQFACKFLFEFLSSYEFLFSYQELKRFESSVEVTQELMYSWGQKSWDARSWRCPETSVSTDRETEGSL